MSELALADQPSLFDFNFSPIPGLASQPAVQAGVGGLVFPLNTQYRNVPTFCGVYKITFGNGSFYYGSATGKGGLRSRLSGHIAGLEGQKHSNGYMQNVFNKYRYEGATFEVVAVTTAESAKDVEQQFISDNFHREKCLNLRKYTNGSKSMERHNKRIKRTPCKSDRKERVFFNIFGGFFNSVDEGVSKFVSLYESGMTTLQIGERYGASHSTIKNLIKDKTRIRSAWETLAMQNRQRILDAGLLDALRASDGVKTCKKSLSKQFKTSRGQVSKIAAEFGIKIVKPNSGRSAADTRLKTNRPKVEQQLQVAKSLLESGSSYGELGENLGMTGSGAAMFCYRHGLRSVGTVLRGKLIQIWGSIENYEKAATITKDLSALGKTANEIAAVIGVTYAMIVEIRRRHNIQLDPAMVKQNRVAAQRKALLDNPEMMARRKAQFALASQNKKPRLIAQAGLLF